MVLSILKANYRNFGWQTWALLACYTASGFVALAYEVLWTKLWMIVFGVSLLGVVLTVSAFLGGLGLGSYLGYKTRRWMIHPLRTLALIEALVACYVLGMPTIVQRLDAIPDFSGNSSGMILSCLGIMVIPAMAIGMGFSWAVQALNSKKIVAILYGGNTLGGVLGALAPLWMIPQWGWATALKQVAYLGLVVAICLGVISFWSRQIKLAESPARLLSGGKNRISLWAYAGIGAAALMLEIGWTRWYGTIWLRTEYVLGIILAIYLLGVGLGSLFGHDRKSLRFLRLMPWIAGFGVLIGILALPYLATWVEETTWKSLPRYLIGQGVAIALMTLPTTLVLGAWFSMLARLDLAEPEILYGVNAFGAVVGALLAGFWLIPHGGTLMVLVTGASLLILCGLVLARAWTHWEWGALVIWAGSVYFILVQIKPVFWLPHDLATAIPVFRYEDAVVSTQVVQEPNGERILLTDLQRRDASSDPTAVFIQSNQGRLPLLLHPNPRSVLFEGLGTGISLLGTNGFPNLDVTAVELSKGAVQASEGWFGLVNQPALSRAHIVEQDARRYFATHTEHFDVIIGDLFHPDLAGAGSMLSYQQWERAQAHLNEHGIFVQWIALNQFDLQDLRLVFRTFLKVFPDGQFFMDGMHLALVGGAGTPQNMASQYLTHLSLLTDEQRSIVSAGEGPYTWLGRYWGPIPPSSGELQDEWHPLLEFHLPWVKWSNQMSLISTMNYLVAERPNVMAVQLVLNLPVLVQKEWRHDYQATSLLAQSWVSGMQGNEVQTERYQSAAMEENPHDRWAAYALSDRFLSRLTVITNHGVNPIPLLKHLIQLNPNQPDLWLALWKIQVKSHDPEAEQSRLEILKYDPFNVQAKSGNPLS